MIIGKINDDVYIDDAVLRETKQKVVINNQQITDLETFNKVVDSIKEKDEEISKLNKIIDIKTNRIQQLMKRLSKRQEKVDRLNNIIDELEKYIYKMIKEDSKYNDVASRYGVLNCRNILDKLKELKEGK